MKFAIKHELKGRMRVHMCQNRMTCAQADILLYYLTQQPNIVGVKVYERTVSGKTYDAHSYACMP